MSFLFFLQHNVKSINSRVTKALLGAQGYYTNCTKVWLPKSQKKVPHDYSSTKAMSELVYKQTQGKGECGPQTHSYSQRPAIHKRVFSQTHLHGKQLRKRWIPKKLLAAQGFFEGQTKLWVPVTKAQVRTSSNNLKESARASKTLTTQKWISKSTLRAQGYYEGESQLWVPKILFAQGSPHKLTNFTISTVISKLSTQNLLLQPNESPNSSNSFKNALENSQNDDRYRPTTDTDQSKMSIKQRATLLQYKLFGH